jgi:hypothetical protein
MDAAELLERLRNGSPGGPLDRLADLVVDDLLARPVREVLEPRWVAEVARDGLRAWLASGAAEARLLLAVEDALVHLERTDRSLEELLPPELVAGIRGLSDRPYHPAGNLLRSLLDREPVRALIRDLLVNALVGFAKRLGSPVTDSKLARGLGGLGRFAKEQARARAGTLGAVATAITDEFERQAERRAVEFADTALSGVISQLIERLTRPGTSPEQAALRRALLDSLLALRGPEVAAELRRADPKLVAASARRVLGTWANREDLPARLESAIGQVLAREGDRTLGESLDSLELRGPTRELTKRAIVRRLGPLVGGDAFAAWLAETMR